jgi:hypothetical protein
LTGQSQPTLELNHLYQLHKEDFLAKKKLIDEALLNVQY